MRLRVWLPPLADLKPEAPLEFEILNAQRRIHSRGEAVIAELPQGLDCELVLDALDVVLLEVKLPKLSRSRLARALPALVEERLVADVERVHVVATPGDAAGQAVAAVVDRALLKRALEIFARAGRRVLQVTPQPLALGMSPGGWRVRWRDGRGSVRTEVFTGMGFESNESPPLDLRLLLAQSVERPSVIDVEGECDAHAWSEALGVPVRQVNATSAQGAPVVLDLLQYELSGGIVRWQDWRATLALGAALLLVALGGLNFHAWELRAGENALRDQMAAMLLETFPQVPVVLDPLEQMRRMTADLRTAAGTGSGGFLSTAAVLGRIAGTDSVQSMEYRNGTLTVRFLEPIASTATEREALARRATEAGLALRFEGDRAVFTAAQAP